MSSEPADFVENAGLLTGVFGGWPSFHDAEVVHVRLDRSGPEGPTLEARVHVFERTDQVDPRGYYVLENHTMVTLLFTAISGLRMGGFNHQNVLSGLALRHGPRIWVEMAACFGLDTSFECSSCRVVEA